MDPTTIAQAMLQTVFGLEVTQSLLVTTDAMVQRAVNAMPKAHALLEFAGRTQQHVRLTCANCGATRQ